MVHTQQIWDGWMAEKLKGSKIGRNANPHNDKYLGKR